VILGLYGGCETTALKLFAGRGVSARPLRSRKVGHVDLTQGHGGFGRMFGGSVSPSHDPCGAA